jgi:hypothetical protein
MKTCRLLILACVVVLCVATSSFAQSVSLVPAGRTAWDVSGSIGWLAGDKSDFAEEWNSWYDTFAASIEVGRYWTPHIKTAVGGTFTTEGSVYSHVQVPAPGQQFPIFIPREHHFRLNAIDIGAAYQFLDNQWVHPFLNAGVQLGWEHQRQFSPEQVFFGRDPRNPLIVPPLDRRDGYDFSARPFIGGGAKFYVNERGFIRTDVMVGGHRGGIGQVSWRVGAGVDF